MSVNLKSPIIKIYCCVVHWNNGNYPWARHTRLSCQNWLRGKCKSISSKTVFRVEYNVQPAYCLWKFLPVSNIAPAVSALFMYIPAWINETSWQPLIFKSKSPLHVYSWISSHQNLWSSFKREAYATLYVTFRLLWNAALFSAKSFGS